MIETVEPTEVRTSIATRAIVLTVITIVALDQVTKLIMMGWLGQDAPVHRWELAGRYVAFQYVENRGAAFGMLEGRTTLLIILAIVVALGFIFIIGKELKQNSLLQIALALMAGGAIGNLADRVRLGFVVDFISIGIWPKFNIADSCITIAIVILAWTSFISHPAQTLDEKEIARD